MQPSRKTGFARTRSQAEHSQLWDGLVGAFAPCLNPRGGSTLFDLSSNRNHGTLTNMSPASDWIVSAGKPALSFSGTNDRVVAGANSPIKTNRFTVGCWFNPSVLSRCDLLTVWSSSYGTGDQFNLLYGLTSGKPQLYVTDGTIPGVKTSGVGSTTLSTGTWYHVAGLFDGVTAEVWVNGVQEASAAAAITLTSGVGQPLAIGDNTLNAGPTTGLLDDCLLWNRVLSRAEMQQLYRLGRGGWAARRSRFVAFSTGAALFTASAALTVGAATCSGSASHTAPTYSGSSAVTVGAATCSGSATHAPPTYTAAAAVSVGAATCAGSATHTVPTFAGTADITIGGATCSGSATNTTPTYSGTAAVSVGAATCSGSATFDTVTFTSSAAVSVGAATCSGSATHTVPTYAGVAAVTAGAATCSGSGAVTNPTYAAIAAVSIGAATCSGTGTFADAVSGLTIVPRTQYGSRFPSRKTGFARSAAMARYPRFWKNLVGAWSAGLNPRGGSTLFDLGGCSNDGTLANMEPSTDWIVDGGRPALSFDGSNEYVSIPDCGPLTFGGGASVTLSAWVNPTSFASYQAIVEKRKSDRSNYWFLVEQTTGKIVFYSANIGVYTPSTTALVAGEWSHVAVVLNAYGGTYYINGRQCGTTPDTTFNFNGLPGYPTLIGGDTTDGYYFGGKIDDVLIHAEAKTANDIRDLWATGRNGWATPKQFSPSATPESLTGTATLAIGAATCSGSASHTAPTFSGSAAVSIGAVTCSGSATHTTPTYTGSAAVSIGGATCSGFATHTTPTYTGDAAVSVGGATCTASATSTGPGTFTATGGVTTGPATCSGSATFSAPIYDSTGAVVIGAVTCTGSGINYSPSIAGTAGVTTGPATCSGAATFTPDGGSVGVEDYPDRDRTTQDQLLRQFVRRLRGKVKGFSEVNCLVTDQEQPEQWPSGNVVCTVCTAPGRFPEAFFAGGGISTLCEVSAIKVSTYVRCKLDKPTSAEAWIVGGDKGLISRFKPAILRAVLCEEKNGEVGPWEPCDEDGVKLLRNQLSPISCSAPTPTGDGQFLGLTITFDTTFDWRL